MMMKKKKKIWLGSGEFGEIRNFLLESSNALQQQGSENPANQISRHFQQWKRKDWSTWVIQCIVDYQERFYRISSIGENPKALHSKYSQGSDPHRFWILESSQILDLKSILDFF